MTQTFPDQPGDVAAAGLDIGTTTLTYIEATGRLEARTALNRLPDRNDDRVTWDFDADAPVIFQDGGYLWPGNVPPAGFTALAPAPGPVVGWSAPATSLGLRLGTNIGLRLVGRAEPPGGDPIIDFAPDDQDLFFTFSLPAAPSPPTVPTPPPAPAGGTGPTIAAPAPAPTAQRSVATATTRCSRLRARRLTLTGRIGEARRGIRNADTRLAKRRASARLAALLAQRRAVARTMRRAC